jgi:hypothetical protein
MMVTKDPRFDINWCHHGRVLPRRAAADGLGGGEIPGGRGPDSAARTNGSAKPAAGTAHSGLSRRSRSSANPAADNHLAVARVNRDASLF